MDSSLWRMRFTVFNLGRGSCVPFSSEFYDDEMLAVMTRALKEAMGEQHRFSGNAAADDELRLAMASHIMAAVARGERDLEELKLAALNLATTRNP